MWNDVINLIRHRDEPAIEAARHDRRRVIRSHPTERIPLLKKRGSVLPVRGVSAFVRAAPTHIAVPPLLRLWAPRSGEIRHQSVGREA